VKNRKAQALDKARTNLLRQMLAAQDWRKLLTLSRVIGANANTARRLLIELGARL
jgi:Holliday junction resolvasome RuvABC DNA-binding subunit